MDPSLASPSPVWVPFFSPAPIAQGVPRGARGVQSEPTPPRLAFRKTVSKKQ